MPRSFVSTPKKHSGSRKQLLTFGNRCKLSFLLLSLLFCFNVVQVKAQVNIKSFVPVDILNEYSLNISLIENSYQKNEIKTYFLIPNFSFENSGQNLYQKIFTEKNSIATKDFLDNHSTNSIKSMEVLLSNTNENLSDNYIVLSSNKKIYFIREWDRVLLTDDYRPQNITIEANILVSIRINDNLSLNFLSGDMHL